MSEHENGVIMGKVLKALAAVVALLVTIFGAASGAIAIAGAPLRSLKTDMNTAVGAVSEQVQTIMILVNEAAREGAILSYDFGRHEDNAEIHMPPGELRIIHAQMADIQAEQMVQGDQLQAIDDAVEALDRKIDGR